MFYTCWDFVSNTAGFFFGKLSDTTWAMQKKNKQVTQTLLRFTAFPRNSIVEAEDRQLKGVNTVTRVELVLSWDQVHDAFKTFSLSLCKC